MRRLVVLGLALLLGCPRAEEPTLDPARLDALARALAAALVACEERGVLEEKVEPEGARDPTLVESALRAYLRALAASAHIEVDPVALEACLAFLESEARCQGLGDEEGDCDRIFTGTLPGGARCALDEECRSEVCVFGPEAACGACAAAETAGEGEHCGQRLCAEGLACNYGGEAPVCLRLREAGERCIEDADGAPRFFACADGLFCAPDDVCRPLLGEGQACGEGRRCEAGLACEGPEGARACRGVPDEVGAPCDPDGAACGASLETGLACALGEGGFACAEAVVVGEGEACDAAPGAEHAARWCLHGLTTTYCEIPAGQTEGACVPRRAPGEPCDDAPCDERQGVCLDDGGSPVCAPWPGAGEPCLAVDGLLSCGPERMCDRDRPSGPVCVDEAPPLRLPSCGG